MIFYDQKDGYAWKSKENLWRELRLQRWIRDHCKTKRRAVVYRAEKDLAARREKIKYPNKRKAKSAWQRGSITLMEYSLNMRRLNRYWDQVQLYDDIIDWLDTMIRNQEAIVWYLEDLTEERDVKPPKVRPYMMKKAIEPGLQIKGNECDKWRRNEKAKAKRNSDPVPREEQATDVEP